MSDVHEGADISPLQRDGDIIVANYHCTQWLCHTQYGYHTREYVNKGTLHTISVKNYNKE